jgi:hypothetical protein
VDKTMRSLQDDPKKAEAAGFVALFVWMELVKVKTSARSNSASQEGGSMSAAKLVVIYPVPTDLEKFERLYLGQHVPRVVDKLIAKTKIVATKVWTSARRVPAPFHRIAEIHFPSMAALEACAALAKETLSHAISISTGGRPIFVVAEEETFTFLVRALRLSSRGFSWPTRPDSADECR